jgi:hypothetical protein
MTSSIAQSQIRDFTISDAASAALVGRPGEVAFIQSFNNHYKFVNSNTLVANGSTILPALGTNNFWQAIYTAAGTQILEYAAGTAYVSGTQVIRRGYVLQANGAVLSTDTFAYGLTGATFSPAVGSGLTWLGVAYNAAATYATGDMIFSGDHIYVATSPSSGEDPSQNDGFWVELSNYYGAPFRGANSVTSGSQGLVPAAAINQEDAALVGGAAWDMTTRIPYLTLPDQTVNNTVISAASYLDVCSAVVLTQTTPNITLYLANPTVTNKARRFAIFNNGTATITLGYSGSSYDIRAGVVSQFVWDPTKVVNGWMLTGPKPMIGASSTTAGNGGTVPAPAAAANTLFLRGDGTWASAGLAAWVATSNYTAGNQAVWSGYYVEALGTQNAGTAFAWGTVAGTATWKPILASSYAWRGVYSSAGVAYAVNDVVALTSTGALYVCNTAVASSDATYNPATGANKSVWTPWFTVNSTFVGATAVANGQQGIVPAPVAGQQGQYLRGDASWGTPTSAMEWKYASSYAANDQAIWSGFLVKANDTIPASTAFAWGTSGATWSPSLPLTAIGTLSWAGIFTVGTYYSVNDVVATSSTSYLWVANSSVASAGAADSPMSVNRGYWRPWLTSLPLMSPASSGQDGQAGQVPSPKLGQQYAKLLGAGIWDSLDRAVTTTLANQTGAFTVPTTSTVDVSEVIVCQQTTASITGTLDTPSITNAPRRIMIANVGSVAITISYGAGLSISIQPNTSAQFFWTAGVIGTASWVLGTSASAAMTGATSVLAGTSGFVPAPVAGQQNGVLLGNATWTSVLSVTDAATPVITSTSTNGPLTIAAKGTGALTLNAAGTGSVNIGSSVTTGSMSFGSASLTGSMTIYGAAINVGGVAAGTISVGTSMTTGSVTIAPSLTTGTVTLGGTAQTTGSTNVRGTAITVGGVAAGTIDVGTSLTTGTITVGGAATTGSISVGNGSMTGAFSTNHASNGTCNIGVGITTGTGQIFPSSTTGTTYYSNAATTGTISIAGGSHTGTIYVGSVGTSLIARGRLQVGGTVQGTIPNRISVPTGYTTTSSFTGYGYLTAAGTVGYNSGSSGSNIYCCEFSQRTLFNGELDVVSDVRAKKDIQTLPDDICLGAVKDLRVVSYFWDDGREDTSQKLGWIAQEVGPVVGNAVTKMPGKIKDEDVDDYHVLDKDQLLAVLWGAVRKLSAEVEELKARL